MKALVLLALLALPLAGCHQDVAGTAQDGAAVFQQVCATCHGPTGKPSAARIAQLNVQDLTAKAFRARVTEALVEHQVRAGSQNKLMPSFAGALTDAQIRAVAAYVASPAFVQAK